MPPVGFEPTISAGERPALTRPEESYRLWCVVVCDLETSRIGAPYIYDISNLRVNEIICCGGRVVPSGQTDGHT